MKVSLSLPGFSMCHPPLYVSADSSQFHNQALHAIKFSYEVNEMAWDPSAKVFHLPPKPHPQPPP